MLYSNPFNQALAPPEHFIINKDIGFGWGTSAGHGDSRRTDVHRSAGYRWHRSIGPVRVIYILGCYRSIVAPVCGWRRCAAVASTGSFVWSDTFGVPAGKLRSGGHTFACGRCCSKTVSAGMDMKDTLALARILGDSQVHPAVVHC
jgi:hypothetical protein